MSTNGANPEILDCDIAVAGGALGGVSAAVVAAERGKKVVLIEAGPRLGGTAVFSGGGIHIWGAKTWEEYSKHCPLAHPVLGRVLFERFDGYVQWLLSTKAPGFYGSSTNRGLTLLKYQIGKSILPKGKLAFFDYMHSRIEQLGGKVLTGVKAKNLMLKDGKVTGIIAERGGRQVTIRTSSVILATGGFQSNKKMLAQYIGPGADEFITRAVEHDMGDGLRMALEAGAAPSHSMDTLYGHLMPAPPCRIGWTNYLDPLIMSAFYAEHGIVVNKHGERFVDEGDGELTGLTINAAARQPLGGMWIIMDHAIRMNYARYELPEKAIRPGNLRYLEFMRYLGFRKDPTKISVIINSLKLAKDRGAIILEAKTISELAQQLAKHGVDSQRLVKTVEDYNAHIKDGIATGLAIPKAKGVHKIDAPPIYAIKVAVGVSMTYGGIAINEHAEALTKSNAPIKGLYAVPGAAGGVQHLHYGGALAACGVYGMIAGERAAEATSLAPATPQP